MNCLLDTNRFSDYMPAASTVTMVCSVLSSLPCSDNTSNYADLQNVLCAVTSHADGT